MHIRYGPRLVILATALAIWASCNDEVVVPVDVATIDVTPAEVVLRVGEVRQFSARIEDATGNELRDRTIEWTTTDGAVATVDDHGRVTALVPGETQVVARVDGVAGEALLRVLAKAVATVEIAPANPVIPHDGSVQLQVTLRASDGSVVTGPTVSFASDDPSIATVDQTGRVRAVGEGTTRITATAEGRSGQTNVTVEPPPAASIEIQPPAATVAVGATAQLNATVLAADGSAIRGHTIAWTSDAPEIVTVNGAGVITGLAVGVGTITAQADGQSAQATVTVTAQRVARLELIPPSASIFVNGVLTLEAHVLADDGTELTARPVQYRSTAPHIASVTPLGEVHGLVQGDALIIATAEGRADTTAIFVVNQPVFAVEVVPPAASVVIGGTVDLDAVLRAIDGTVLARPVTWSSSDQSIATVTDEGIVTGVKVGTVTITATSEGKSGTATVTVSPKPVAQVSVSPATPALFVGDVVQLRASLTAADGSVLTGRQVAWTTSAAGVATVDNTGNVKGIAAGTATITATSEGVSGTATVTVSLRPVATVTVTPADTTLFTGETATLVVELKAADGTVLTGRPVTWSSSASGIASVPSSTATSTTVTAAAAGDATITATAEGVSGTATVHVLDRVASVTVTPSTVRLAPGAPQQFQATLRSASGAVLTGRTITWQTSDAGVFALATTTGDIVNGTAGSGAGSATITATAEGVDGTAAVTVALNVGSVTISPNPPPDLLPGQNAQLMATVRAADGTVLTDRPVTWTADAALLSVTTSGAMNDRATITALPPSCTGARCATTVGASADGMTAQVVVNVLKPVAIIDISPVTPPQLAAGATLQLTAALRAADGTVLSGRPLAWSSLTPAVATVDATTGIVTAAANPSCAAGSETCSVVIRATASNAPGTTADDVTKDVTLQVRKRVASVQVTPPGPTIIEGATQNFDATVRAGDGTVLTGRVITWSASPSAVAGVNPTTGVTTTAFTNGPGTATITATAEGVSGSAQLNVSPRVASVTVLPSSATIAPGASQSFTVELRAANGALITGRTVTWQNDDPAVFGLTSTTNTGAAGTAITDGQARITASAEGVSGSATVTVRTPVASVTVLPPSANLKPGESQTFTAELRSASGTLLTGRTVTWASSQPSVFGLTPSTTGSVSGTAAADGTSTITAMAEGITGNATVTVVTPVASVVVSPPTASLAPGGTQSFTVQTLAANGTPLTGRTVNWQVDQPGVFNLTSSSNTGASGTAVADGTARVTATSEGISDFADVTVVTPPVPVATVEISPDPAPGMAPGGVQAFSALAKDAGGNTLTGRVVTWSVAPTGVVTLSATTGNAIDVTAIADGTATLTASIDGVTHDVTIDVVTPPVPVATVEITPNPAPTIAPGAQQTFTAVARDAANNVLTGRTVTWSVSQTTVISLSSTTGGMIDVTGVADGTATLTATVDGVSTNVTVNVHTPVATVAIVPSGNVNLPAGTSQAFVAELRDAAANLLTGRTVTWTVTGAPIVTLDTTTGDAVTATVDATAAPGQIATITATSEGIVAQVTVTVQ